MPYTKTIVCLANSRKTSGRCIAGKEIVAGNPTVWVRPVSARPTHEISEEERMYVNGRHPQVLEVMRIPFLAPQPLIHQPENHQIDASLHWEHMGAFPKANIGRLLDRPASLWGQGSSSTEYQNNRVAVGALIDASLYLVPVEELTVLVGPVSAFNPRRGVKGQFSYQGIQYRMAMTDPHIERMYLDCADGEYKVKGPALCISLGDEFGGYYYKLIAAVIHYQ